MAAAAPARPRTADDQLHAPPREQWTALIRDAHPGYISFEQFELNERLLAANAHAHGTDRAAGPAREGPALLQGLAVCGRCGRRMTVRYHQRRGTLVPDYQCIGDNIQRPARAASPLPGAGVDEAIGQLLLDTVTPLALEVALTVQAELEARADEADRLRHSHVERARQRAELARRRYLAVDPDNRLVADTLEADWNDALRAAPDRPGRLRARQRRRPRRARRPAQGTDPPARRRLPRALDRPRHPAARAQAHRPAADRGRHPRPHRPDPPAHPLPRRPDHQPHAPDPAAAPGKPARPTPTRSRCSTGCSTSTPTPRPPTRSTTPVTAPAPISPSPPASCSTCAATTTSPATPIGSAPAACSPPPRSPSASPAPHHDQGLATRRPAHRHKANDKNKLLFEPPDPSDPRLVKQLGRRLNRREPTQPHQEVHYEANALSKQEPTAPIDWAMPASWQAWPKVRLMNWPPWSE